MRRVLDCHRIRTRHDCARDREISQQGHVAGQHRFAFVTEVLEGRDRISQIHGDTLPDVIPNTALYEKKARCGESRGNQQHRQ